MWKNPVSQDIVKNKTTWKQQQQKTCPTQSPGKQSAQYSSHCSPLLLCFVGKRGLYDHSICLYVYVSVLIPEFWFRPTVILQQHLTKGQRKQPLASSYKFCENYQGGDSVIPGWRSGWHVRSQRAWRIPTNSSAMGKVSAVAHNQPLDTNL